MLAEPHRHQARIVGDLEAFDLQVMLGMAEAEVACVVGEAHVFGDLVQHALVELGPASGQARLELGAPADGAVHEQAEAHSYSLFLLPDRGPPGPHLSPSPSLSPWPGEEHDTSGP